MRKFLLLVVIVMITGFGVNAQEKNAPGKPAMSMYAEAGGPGVFSVNFDSRFTKKDDGIGGRIGIGTILVVDELTLITVPVGLTYLLSKDNKNYFEVGGGVTFVTGNSSSFIDDGTLESTFGHLNFGYRLQPKAGGFLFRAALNPVFGQGAFIPYYGGIAIGYKF